MTTYDVMKGRIEMDREIQTILKKYNQEHLIEHYETLDENNKKKLLDK